MSRQENLEGVGLNTGKGVKSGLSGRMTSIWTVSYFPSMAPSLRIGIGASLGFSLEGFLPRSGSTQGLKTPRIDPEVRYRSREPQRM